MPWKGLGCCDSPAHQPLKSARFSAIWVLYRRRELPSETRQTPQRPKTAGPHIVRGNPSFKCVYLWFSHVGWMCDIKRGVLLAVD